MRVCLVNLIHVGDFGCYLFMGIDLFSTKKESLVSERVRESKCWYTTFMDQIQSSTFSKTKLFCIWDITIS